MKKILLLFFILPVYLLSLDVKEDSEQEIFRLNLSFDQIIDKKEFLNLIDEQIRLGRVNCIDNMGRSLLASSIIKCNRYMGWEQTCLKIIQKLIDSKANVNIRDQDRYGFTPILHVANISAPFCSTEYIINVAKLLFKHGADVNVKDNLGRTILTILPFAHLGVGTLREFLKFLLDYHCKHLINERDASHQTPLLKILEIGSDYYGIVDLLLLHGADINIRNSDGKLAKDMVDKGLLAFFSGNIAGKLEKYENRQHEIYEKLYGKIPVPDLCNIILDYL